MSKQISLNTKQFENKYYDGTKILSMHDLDNERPEIYMVTSNRNAGKTTFFRRWFLSRYLKYNEKFVVLYRFNNLLSNVSAKFFRGIDTLFFKDYVMTERVMSKGKYVELYIRKKDSEIEENCGYAIAINDSDSIKDLSSLFSDAYRILFDEFQSETFHYCPDEIRQFISIHTSLARGGGEQVKYLPVFMLSNYVTLLNPYFTAMNVSHRIQSNTKFLRGHGFVLECGFNKNASESVKTSRFNMAFPNAEYVAYAAENVYLNDNTNFIEKIDGQSIYLATLIYNKKRYALRKYSESSILYCDKRIDETYRFRIAVRTVDHNIDSMLLTNYDDFIVNLRMLFKQGAFRFYDLECKECVMTLLSY